MTTPTTSTTPTYSDSPTYVGPDDNCNACGSQEPCDCMHEQRDADLSDTRDRWTRWWAPRPVTYEEALVEACAEDSANLDQWMGTLFVRLDDDIVLYCTPFWEGSTGLPWALHDESGNVDGYGTVPVQWTRDLKQDVALWKRAVTDLVMRLEVV